MIRILLFNCLLLLQFTLVSQNSRSSRIAKFSIQVTNDNKVFVSWTMKAGSTCPLLKVEKSLDTINFQHAYTYPSVCGSSSKEESYSWIDANPRVYAVNYYRLNLQDIEFTAPIEVDLQSRLANEQLLVSPNPSDGTFKIELRNSQKLIFDFSLFNKQGALMMQDENLKGTEFSIDLSGFKSGNYTLKITFEDDETLEKKLIKL